MFNRNEEKIQKKLILKDLSVLIKIKPRGKGFSVHSIEVYSGVCVDLPTIEDLRKSVPLEFISSHDGNSP